MTPGHLEAQMRYAQLLAASTIIPKHLRNNPANVLLFLALAEAHDIKPAVAFTAFQVIGDTPTAKPEFMRGQITKAGHTLTYVEHSATKCVLHGKRGDNGSEMTVTWTIDKAKVAGLDPTKGTWAKYPEAMLSARATSELGRALFPDCLNGVSYTAEELGAVVDEDGDVLAEAHAQAVEQSVRQHEPAPAGAVKRGPVAPENDPWTGSDPAALAEWREVLAAAVTLEDIEGAAVDMKALIATGQISAADRPALLDEWNARKAEVTAAAAEVPAETAA